MHHPNEEHDDDPRTNSREDLGWTPAALHRYAASVRGREVRAAVGAPLSARSAKAFIEDWLAGEEP